MRTAAVMLVLAGLLVAADASAYPRVERRGDFGAFMSRLATAARRHDMRTLRRLTDRKSLATIDHEPDLRRVLAVLAEFAACYRTNAKRVQCEMPDPGPELEDTRLKQPSFAIFERGPRGWKMNELRASYWPR